MYVGWYHVSCKKLRISFFSSVSHCTESPSMQTVCSCDCKVVEGQVSAIEAGMREHKGQLAQVRKELATAKGHIVSCEDALQAKDQQIVELQQTITDLRTERLQREDEFAARLSAIEAQVRSLQPP